MNLARLRQGLKGAVTNVERRRRLRYAFPAVGPADGSPTIYFSVPDWNQPSGGLKVAYDHVQALNDAGVPARVLHQKSGFRLDWFDNDAPVTCVPNVTLGPDDVIVVAEVAVDVFIRSRCPARHIVLNQSGHLTFQTSADMVMDHMLTCERMLGSVVVSQHSAEYLRTAFPGRPVARARNAVDPSVFYPERPRPSRVLGYSLRRGRDDILQALSILEARGSLEGWEVREIAGADQRRYAKALAATRVLLSAPYQEGFGLPAAEAMACGAYVVGYDGFGGREYFRPEFSSPIATGDVLALAMATEDVLVRDREDPGWLDDRSVTAAAFIAEEYSPQRSALSVVDAYAAILGTQWPL